MFSAQKQTAGLTIYVEMSGVELAYPIWRS